MKKVLKEKLMKSSLTKRKKDEVLTKLELDDIKDESYVKIMTDLGFKRFGSSTEFYVNFK
jgi:hypothetical protein